MPLRARKSQPAFRIGDRVRVTFPGVLRGQIGEVTEILDHKGDYVYRYRIRFENRQTATVFEFEVELL